MNPGQLPPLILLEDNALVALDLENLIGETGLANAIWVATLPEAHAACTRHPAAPALLDVDINGETSLGLARELVMQGRRIAFLTGYGDLGALPPALADVRILGKPVDPAELAALLREMMDPA